MRRSVEESFDDFAVFAIPRPRQVAHAWSRDRHCAEDAVQGTLERVFAAWPRVRRGEAYAEEWVVRVVALLVTHLWLLLRALRRVQRREER